MCHVDFEPSLQQLNHALERKLYDELGNKLHVCTFPAGTTCLDCGEKIDDKTPSICKGKP